VGSGPGVAIDVPAIAYLEVDTTTGNAGIVCATR